MSVSATLLPSTSAMTPPMSTAAPEGQEGDGLVLAADEGHRALEDHVGDLLHRGRAGVGAQDRPGEVEGEGDRGQAGCRNHPDDELHESSDVGRQAWPLPFPSVAAAGRSVTRKRRRNARWAPASEAAVW